MGTRKTKEIRNRSFFLSVRDDGDFFWQKSRWRKEGRDGPEMRKKKGVGIQGKELRSGLVSIYGKV